MMEWKLLEKVHPQPGIDYNFPITWRTTALMVWMQHIFKSLAEVKLIDMLLITKAEEH